MAAVALIKFTQGVTVGNDGEALVVSGGATITIENASNTDVVAWTIDLVEAPPGSILHTDPGVWTNLGAASDNTPIANFLPDAAVPGSYRIRLEVEDSLGVKNVDIRNVCVLTDNRSIVLSPYMELPQPLPVPNPTSPQPDQKPDELNFGGQKLGWCGGAGGTPVLMNDVLLDFDKMPPTTGLSANDTAYWNGSKWAATSAVQTDGTFVMLQPSTGSITLNVPTGQAHILKVNNVEIARFDDLGASPRLLFPFVSGQGAHIKLADRTTDGAGSDLFFEGQKAQGTNQNGGGFVFNVGAATGSGTDGHLLVQVDGSNVLEVQLDSYSATFQAISRLYLYAGTPSISDYDGWSVTIKGGSGSETIGYGGNAWLLGGDAASEGERGGDAVVQGGVSGSVSGKGGLAVLEGGSVHDDRTNGDGGDAYVRGGFAKGTGEGGSVLIESGLSPSGKPGSIDIYVYKSNGGANYGTINFRTGTSNPPNNLCMVLGDSARDSWYAASDGWYLAYDSALGEAVWRVLPS
jgi:hypothetical protein